MDNATCGQPEKQSSIISGVNSLQGSLERLEKFVGRVKDNNEPRPMETCVEPKKEREPSLSQYLNILPQTLESCAKRIELATEELRNLLY
jgi:hypothetical protein